MTTESTSRTLLELYRARGENPFVIHGEPRRRGWLLAVLALCIVGIAALVYAISLLIGVFTDSLDGMMPALAGIWSTAVAGLPVVVGAFRWSWRDRAKLEELLLTRLTREECAFGSIYWGAALAVLMHGLGAAAMALGTVAAILTGAEPWVIVLGVTTLLVTGPLGLLHIAFAARALLDRRMGWAGALFVAPFSTGAFGLVAFFYGLALTVPIGAGWFEAYFWATNWRYLVEEFARTAVIGVTAAVALPPMLRVALHGAARSYFYPVQPEEALREEWITRERVCRKLPLGQREALAKLTARLRPARREQFGVVLAVLGAGMLLSFVSAAGEPGVAIGSFALLSMLAVPLGGVACGAWTRRRYGMEELLVSGSLAASLRAHMLAPALLWWLAPIVLGAAAAVLEGNIQIAGSNPVEALAAAVAGFIMMGLFLIAVATVFQTSYVWGLLPGTQRARRLILFTSLAAATFMVLAVAEESFRAVAALLGVAQSFLCLVGVGSAYDAAHTQVLRDIPAGLIASDTMADPNAPIIPDTMASS